MGQINLVRAALPHIADHGSRIRINCVSPTVLADSTAYHGSFPGFPPVPAAEVALAYLRAVSTPITGRVLKVHKLG